MQSESLKPKLHLVTDTGLASTSATPRAAYAELLAKHGAFMRTTRFYYRIHELTRLADWAMDKVENAALSAITNKPIDRPVFPMGNFRSGTSLLEKVIADHPAVGGFTYASQVFPRSPYLVGKVLRTFPSMDEPMLPIHLPNEVRSTSPYEAEPLWRFCRNNYWTGCPTNVLDGEFSDPEFEQILHRTINKALHVQSATRFINKNPWNTLRIGYLARLFPDAKFLYIVRHPNRMVQSQLDLESVSALAWHDMPQFGERFSDQFAPPRLFFRTPAHADIVAAHARDKALGTALSIVDFDTLFDQEVEKAGLENKVLRLRYEDLVADFDASMQRVFSFLELAGPEADSVIASNTAHYVVRNRPERNRQAPWSEAVTSTLQPMLAKYGYSI